MAGDGTSKKGAAKKKAASKKAASKTVASKKAAKKNVEKKKTDPSEADANATDATDTADVTDTASDTWLTTPRKFGLVVGGIVMAIIGMMAYGFFSEDVDVDTNRVRPLPAEPGDVNDMVDGINGTVFDPQKPNAWQIISSIFTTQMVIEEIMEEGLEKLIRKLHGKLTGGKIADMPGVTTVLKITYRTLKASPAAFYTLFTSPTAAIAGTGARLSSMGAGLAGAGFRLYVQTGAMIHSLFTTSLVSKLSVANMKFLLGASLGPIMWAIQLISSIGMLVDFWDPNKENDRLDWSDINDRTQYAELRQAYLAKLNGQAWPPIAPIQRLFPEEHAQATEEVFGIYKNKAIDFVLQNPERDDGLTAFVLQLALGIPDKAINEALASDPEATRSMGAKNTEEMKDKFLWTISEMMEKSPEYKDSVFYSSLVRKITENGVRDHENAKRAPFWYFALSIPTSFYTGTLDVEDIPPMKRGITYNNLTVMDIKVTPEQEHYGKRYIDIFRAKSPYFEERVRAYRVAIEDIREDDIAEAAIPIMPDIADISMNGTAVYRRYEKASFSNNMVFDLFSNVGTDEAKAVGPKMHDHEKEFGFRDEDADNYDGRARDGAHSRWLAMCCFQQFLLELAQHPGVSMETKTVMGGVELVRGVFKWKEKYYRAFPPRPWHEPRFVDVDVRFSRTEGNTSAVYLTEAASFRWNEVFEHQRVAGSVLTDLRNTPADETPYIPVAVWTDDYADVDMNAQGATPTPPQTRLLSSMKNVVSMHKKNGRVVFVRKAESLIIRVIKNSDFVAITSAAKANGVSDADISRDFGKIFGTPDDVILDNFDVEDGFNPSSDKVFLKVDVIGEAYIMCNRNFAGQNTWRRKTAKVFESSSDVTSWPDMNRARQDAMNDKDFKKRMRNVKGAVFFANANLSGRSIGGVFDVEVDVEDSVTEKVWTHPRGTPRTGVVSELKVGEDADLDVTTYKVKVSNKDNDDKEEICYFLNHDGSIDNKWQPVEVRRKLSGRRMLFLPVQEAYLYGTKGMQNDDSMMRGSSKDDELARRCGIYENYNVTNKSGVPHAMLEKKESSAGCARLSFPISFADVYDRDAFDSTYIRLAFSTFHNGRVVILSSARDKADMFCRAFKGGERYETIESAGRNDRGDLVEYGRCKIPWYQTMWEFLLGTTITKSIGRSLPI